jgi:hypothetical protein
MSTAADKDVKQYHYCTVYLTLSTSPQAELLGGGITSSPTTVRISVPSQKSAFVIITVRSGVHWSECNDLPNFLFDQAKKSKPGIPWTGYQITQVIDLGSTPHDEIKSDGALHEWDVVLTVLKPLDSTGLTHGFASRVVKVFTDSALGHALPQFADTVALALPESERAFVLQTVNYHRRLSKNVPAPVKN